MRKKRLILSICLKTAGNINVPYRLSRLRRFQSAAFEFGDRVGRIVARKPMLRLIALTERGEGVGERRACLGQIYASF